MNALRKLDEEPSFPSFLYNPSIYVDETKTYIVLDFETHCEDKDGTPSAIIPENGMVLAVWRVCKGDRVIVEKALFADEYGMEPLLRDIRKADFWVAHNSKFEAGWLKRLGLDLRKTLGYCTMLGAYVLDGNEKNPRDLNSLAQRYGLGTKLDYVNALIKTGVSARDILPNWLEEYCRLDVDLTHKVFLQQVREIETAKQLHLVHTRNLTALVLADIEQEGMSLDAALVDKEYIKTLRSRNYLRLKLRRLAGNINLNSSHQLADYLYDVLGFEELKHRGEPVRTETGLRGTDTATIAKLVATTTEQRDFLDKFVLYNKQDNLLQKNLEFFHGVVHERDGSFKAEFRQGVTVTHRLSSGGIPQQFEGQKKRKSVQFQNLPREYKCLFTVKEDGYVIGECDGASLEFRVAADVCHDTIAREEIINGADIHSFTAKVLTDAGEPTTRQGAKASTFAPLYGGNGKTPAQKAYAIFFKEKYAGIAKTQLAWCMEVAAHKKLRLPWGMIFKWPNAQLNSKTGRVNVATEIHNYPVQSFATGEIIPIALIHFWYRCANTSITIINTIHDSIVTKLKASDSALFEEISKVSLTTDVYKFLDTVYNYKFQIPLGVGIKVGSHWGTSPTEIVYSVNRDGTFTRKEK